MKIEYRTQDTEWRRRGSGNQGIRQWLSGYQGAGNLRWLSHKLTSYDFFLLDRVISEIRGLNSLPI
jgi:hypothetical protein